MVCLTNPNSPCLSTFSACLALHISSGNHRYPWDRGGKSRPCTTCNLESADVHRASSLWRNWPKYTILGRQPGVFLWVRVPLWFTPLHLFPASRGWLSPVKNLSTGPGLGRLVSSLLLLPSTLPPSFVSWSSPVSLSAPRRNFAKMMQEVSITVAYDAHVINQINEEDFFASLVANSKPKPVVRITQMAFYCFFLSFL